MKVLVYGGRKFDDRDRLYASLYRLAKEALSHNDPIVIIQGMAPGADRLAREWAIDSGHAFEDFPAEWTNFDLPGCVRRQHGSNGAWFNATAGHYRNQQMIDVGHPECAVECPGGKGTADMRSRLKKNRIPIFKIS